MSFEAIPSKLILHRLGSVEYRSLLGKRARVHCRPGRPGLAAGCRAASPPSGAQVEKKSKRQVLSRPAGKPRQDGRGRSRPVDESLERRRRRIDVIDSRLIDLLACRQAEVESILELKKTYNLPAYHPAREENLISDRRMLGERAGLDPEFIDELFRCVLRQSRVKQTAQLTRKSVHRDAVVLIVGGRGRMGRYLSKWFKESGYEVRILDRGDWPQARNLCRGIDLALVSVPIQVTGAVIRKLAPLLPPECVLADLTSIKEAPLEAMLKCHSGPVVGFHPLFGPMTSTMDKQVVVFVHGRGANQYKWILGQFASWGNILLKAGAHEHDEIMAVVQALRHFATFVLGRFLSRRGFDLYRTLEFSSPIYRLELGMVGRFFAQDPQLYAEIIFSSEDRRRLMQEFLRSSYENLSMLEKNQKSRFIEEFRKVARWFGPFSEQAMRESTFLVDRYIERF